MGDSTQEFLDFLSGSQEGVESSAGAEEETECPFYSVGDLIGEWRVTGLLGRGGQGDVYRVVDKKGEASALKLLRRLDPSARARFAFEIELMKGRNLSALPAILDEGFWQDRPYVVMELLEPVDVPTDERDIARYLVSVCQAVSQLHKRGIIHRDLKPTNVMRRNTGEVVLIDVGLAKDVSLASRPREGMTVVDGALVGMGTPGYAAPEQMSGGETTVRTDVHALGLLARTAFQLRAEEQGRIFSDDEIPSVWRAIITRATSSVASQRYPSVEALAQAIRWRHRRRWIVGLLLAVVLVGGGLSARWSMGDRDMENVTWNRLCETRIANQIPVTTVALQGMTNVFQRPIQLAEGCFYRIVGPGRLDATLLATGSNTVVEMENCTFINRTHQPIDKGGIFYRIVGRGSYLNFLNLSDPGVLPPQYPRYDGAYNRVRYGGPLTREELDRIESEESANNLRRENR